MISGVGEDWARWHDRYDDPASSLSARLEAVQGMICAALDDAPPGPIRVVSLCAGDGRDLAGATADHPRRGDVDAVLVELDPALAARATARLAEAGIAGRVVQADAGHTDAVAGAVPADVLLLCGIFGNVTDDDIRATIDAVPQLCAPGATVLWTRHRRAPDVTPAIRGWFDGIGATARAFASVGPGTFAVGAERFGGEPRPLRPARLFTFVR